MFKVVPVKDITKLILEWPDLPETHSKWRCKPLSYLGHVIGHEGPNSLLSELTRLGLATSLSAGGS